MTTADAVRRRVWLQEQIGGAPGATVLRVANVLTGTLDVVALRAACLDVLAAWPSLRTGLRADGTAGVEHPPADVLTVGADAADDRPFDLARELPIRFTLVPLSRDEHLFVVTAHRVALDDSGLGPLATAFGAAYRARLAGRSPTLAEPKAPVPSGPVPAAERAFWLERLADPPVLDLGARRVAAFRPAAVPIDLDPAAAAAVRGFAGEGGVVPPLLVSFAALLHRVTAAPDVVVGHPVTRGGYADLVPVRAGFVSDPALDEVLADVAATVTRGVTCGMPFDEIVHDVGPRRGRGQPLAGVLLSVRPADAFLLDLPGVRAQARAVAGVSGQVDLAVSLVDDGETLRGHLEFDAAQLDRATVERLGGQWQALLAGWAARPGARVSTLPLMSGSDSERVLVRWNETTAEPPSGSVDELFAEQAARTPDRVAVLFRDGQWTYRWLHERAAALAGELVRRGVSFEEPVAVGLTRSPEFFVAVLAVLRCHATYLAVDPAYPADRIRYMLADSGARILLTERDIAARLPTDDVDVVVVSETGHARPVPVREPVDGSRAAYLIYTSGSSGVPKAVVGTQRATVNRLGWMWRRYPFEPGEMCCQKASLSFGDSVWETFGGLLRGVPTYIAADEEVHDPDRFTRALSDVDVSRCTVVPSLLWLLLARPGVAARLTRLRILVSSGEALESTLARHVRTALPETLLLNLYGSSEVAADVTAWECTTVSDGPGVPIGRPIDNARVYVLDARLAPVPVGGDGELFVGGVGLARGYAGRPGMTADRFVPNPHGPGRLYRTGDRCRWRADGVLEYLGRLDDQVKVRGMRVEPGEVEAVMSTAPSVAACAVVGRVFGDGDTRLVCFVVPAAGRRVDRTALRRFARDRLPEFLVPSMFVPVAELPKTASGKIARRELSMPDPANEPPPPATSDLEREVAAVWAEILEVDQVGATDNFFALGGDSVRMMGLAGRLSTLLGRQVGLRILYLNQSVEEFCRAVTR